MRFQEEYIVQLTFITENQRTFRLTGLNQTLILCLSALLLYPSTTLSAIAPTNSTIGISVSLDSDVLIQNTDSCREFEAECSGDSSLLLFTRHEGMWERDHPDRIADWLSPPPDGGSEELRFAQSTGVPSTDPQLTQTDPGQLEPIEPTLTPPSGEQGQAVVSENPRQAPQTSPYILLILSVVTSVGAAITAMVAWRMYRSRLRVEGQQIIQVPERLIEDTTEIVEGNARIADHFQYLAGELEKKFQVFETMANEVDEKNRIIGHLRGETGAKLLGSFAKSIMKLVVNLGRDIQASDPESALHSELIGIRRELVEILGENGFTPFEIPPGTDFRNTGQAADNRGRFVTTDDPAQDWLVKETRFPGLKVAVSGGENVVEKAVVSVYRMSEG